MKSHTVARLGYNTTLALTAPLWAAYVIWHGRRRGRGLQALREQLGYLPPELFDGASRRIWLHAVSAGETVASVPIVEHVAEALPEAEIVFSATTAAGQTVARSKLAVPKHFLYFPLDMPCAVRRSLSAVRPIVFASVEAEIWPNFLACAKESGVRTALLNGVVSDATLRRASRVGRVYGWALSCIDRFCMQTDRDAERIISLGAQSDRVEVVGNTKFDEPFPELTESEIVGLREEFRLPDGVKVLVAGSVNAGEEKPIIEAFLLARQSHPNLRLIIAPRQLDRAAPIVGLARSFGLRVGLRTHAADLDGSEEVVVLDTMGELAKVYAVAAVAFVGGTLIPKGGHNLLQPAAQGKPVFFGPHTFKTADVARMLLEAGVGFEVNNVAELTCQIVEILNSPTRLLEIDEAARELIAKNRGTARRCASALVDLFQADRESACAR